MKNNHRIIYDDELDSLERENERLKQNLSECVELNAQLIKQNDELKNEINMLKITIARNESYIKRLTHVSTYRS